MFGFFERLVNPFPDETPKQPPRKLVPFIWHYARPFTGLFIASIVLSGVIAAIEVYAFDLVGSVVDWMNGTTTGDFWPTYGWKIALICVLIAIIWPLLTLLDDLIHLQGTLGNMAMSIRWRGHRYLLRQSTSFFANDFAGRISTKLMQTAVGARDVVVKLTNLFVYMLVYFASALFLFAQSDWRLAIPLVLWLIAYVAVMIIFLPRVSKWSIEQSDARSLLTGRIVDAYTNIQTVKLFASSDAEDAYAKDGMKHMLSKVYGTMRVVTSMSFALHLLNGLLIAGSILAGSLLWSSGAITAGALAFAATMALRLQGLSHYFLWEMAALFENIGRHAKTG